MFVSRLFFLWYKSGMVSICKTSAIARRENSVPFLYSDKYEFYIQSIRYEPLYTSLYTPPTLKFYFQVHPIFVLYYWEVSSAL